MITEIQKLVLTFGFFFPLGNPHRSLYLAFYFLSSILHNVANASRKTKSFAFTFMEISFSTRCGKKLFLRSWKLKSQNTARLIFVGNCLSTTVTIAIEKAERFSINAQCSAITAFCCEHFYYYLSLRRKKGPAISKWTTTARCLLAPSVEKLRQRAL